MKAWRVVRAGSPTEALSFDDIDRPVAGPREVLIRTSATVLNYNEVDGCRGRYLTVNPPMPYTLGMEVVGTVVEAGEGAQVWLGRRVMATASGAFGAHAEYVAAGIDMVFDAPTALDDTEAAAFFFPFHLAYLGLFERGGLQRGEWVLIHAAAGGVGSAAVQLAIAAGARVIATAGAPDKLALARSLGAEVVIDYRRDDVVAACDQATGGAGVDLVFDGVGGEVTATSVRALARGGRLMMIGFASGIEAEDLPMMPPRALMFAQCSIGGVLLAYSSDAAAVRSLAGINLTPRTVGDRVHARLLDLLAEGGIRPVVGEVVDAAELPAALDRMEARRTVGRVVVRW